MFLSEYSLIEERYHASKSKNTKRSDKIVKNGNRSTKCLIDYGSSEVLSKLECVDLYDHFYLVLSEVLCREINNTTVDECYVDEARLDSAVEECLEEIKNNKEIRDIYENTLVTMLIRRGYFDVRNTN